MHLNIPLTLSRLSSVASGAPQGDRRFSINMINNINRRRNSTIKLTGATGGRSRGSTI
jgi:hypothetical protein